VLSLFAIPKPFRAHIRVTQTNAIRSWTLLQPRPEIILFGNEEGTAQIAEEFGLVHIPEVGRNEYGTPLLSSLFALAQSAASNSLLCYINSDIILTSSFAKAVRLIGSRKKQFAMVGRRCMVDLDKPLDFASPGWEDALRAYASREGKFDHWGSMDYLVFPRGAFTEVPPFAVGRGAWDTWMVYNVCSRGLPLVNVTPDVLAVHQNHDHSHSYGGLFTGPEAKRNLALVGPRRFCIADATYVLKNGCLSRALAPVYLWRRFYTLPVLHPHPLLAPLRWMMRVLVWVTRPVRWKLGARL